MCIAVLPCLAQEAPPAAATQAPNPAGAPRPVMVPAGAVLNVRLSQGIDVDSTQMGITGTIVAASGEEHLKLRAETLLHFTLAAAVRVRP